MDVRPLQGVMNVAEQAAQGRLLFHQVHFETLVGDAQRCRHPRQSAADDESRCRHRQLAGRKGLEMPRPGDGHRHQVHRLGRGRDRVVFVDPGTLVANVGHGEQVLIQAALTERLLEEDFVSPGRAGGHHQPVELVLPDHVLDVLLVGVRAGVHAGFGVADVAHSGRVLGNLLDVDDRSDVVAAVANEPSHPRGFVGNVPLPGVFVALDHGAANGRQLIHGAGRRRRGLGHRFGNVLGLLERSGHVEAGPGRRQWGQPVSPRKTKFVEIDSQPPGHILKRGVHPHPHAEHHQVEALVPRL